MKTFRIVVKTEVHVYLDVQAENADEAYKKVRDIDPMKGPLQNNGNYCVNVGEYQELDGVNYVDAHVANPYGVGRSRPADFPNKKTLSEDELESHQFTVWKDQSPKYDPGKMWVEEVHEIPPLTRVINKWNMQEGGSDTFEALMKELKKVLPSQVVNDLREWRLPVTPTRGYYWEDMHGVGEKTTKRIAHFNETMKDSDDLDKVLSLPDFPRK